MKTIFFFLLAIFSIQHLQAQRFTHGAGVGIFVTDAPLTDIGAFGTLTYSPRLNVYESEAISLSLGVPLNIGFSGNYSYENYGGYIDEQNSIRFMLNAPLLLNLNVGAGSTKENEKRFGFFAGGGFGLHYGDYQYSVIENGFEYYESKYEAGFGPAANLGVRFAVGSHQKNIEARFSYMKTITQSKTSVYGMGAVFNF